MTHPRTISGKFGLRDKTDGTGWKGDKTMDQYEYIRTVYRVYEISIRQNPTDREDTTTASMPTIKLPGLIPASLFRGR